MMKSGIYITWTILLAFATILVLTGCPQPGTSDEGNSPSYWANVYTSEKSETPKKIIATDDGGYPVVRDRRSAPQPKG
ncbi:MAG: hypothetical protein U5P10_09360 [Spirochaetia bacterium]|nr:hypothetical protein [Spirochaetia bacterium]